MGTCVWRCLGMIVPSISNRCLLSVYELTVSFITYAVGDFWEQTNAKMSCLEPECSLRCTEKWAVLLSQRAFVFFVLQTWQELRMVAWECSNGVTPSRSPASEVQATPESPGYDSTTKETRLQGHTCPAHCLFPGERTVDYHRADVTLFLALENDCTVMRDCQIQKHFHTSSQICHPGAHLSGADVSSARFCSDERSRHFELGFSL